MMKWFNLADVHKDKHMTDTISSYRSRIARTHAAHARHIDVPAQTSGRPKRITVLTAEGIEALYEPGETLPKLKPFQPPMRLTDKARAYIVGPGEFSTAGLEPRPRYLASADFIAFLVKIGNDELIEPDFVPL